MSLHLGAPSKRSRSPAQLRLSLKCLLGRGAVHRPRQRVDGVTQKRQSGESDNPVSEAISSSSDVAGWSHLHGRLATGVGVNAAPSAGGQGQDSRGTEAARLGAPRRVYCGSMGGSRGSRVVRSDQGFCRNRVEHAIGCRRHPVRRGPTTPIAVADSVLSTTRSGYETGCDRCQGAHVSVRLPGDTTAPAVARDAVASAIGRNGDVPRRVVDDVRLAVSELVSNAVVHGAPPQRVDVWSDPPKIRVEVVDAASTAERFFGPPSNGGGFGLKIVAALASAWGVEFRPDDHYKVVWFEVRAPVTET